MNNKYPIYFASYITQNILKCVTHILMKIKLQHLIELNSSYHRIFLTQTTKKKKKFINNNVIGS